MVLHCIPHEPGREDEKDAGFLFTNHLSMILWEMLEMKTWIYSRL